MGIADPGTAIKNGSRHVPAFKAGVRALHRLKLVRRQQGISRRIMAERMHVDIQQVQYQECESTDLLLSSLYAWREVLDVPVASLLVGADDSLNSPILERSILLGLMETVSLIHNRARHKSVRRMARNMLGQIVDIMPELAHAQLGQSTDERRQFVQVGAPALRRLPESMFILPSNWGMQS